MTDKIKKGDLLPQFKVKDHEGYYVSDEDIIGTPIVLYFYPKDGTPGCTQEACHFRDNLEKFESQEVLVLGISPDNQQSHKKFIKEHNLNITLLSDEDHKMSEAFGVFKEGKLERSTFLIDSTGVIQWLEQPVTVDGHTDRVLKAIEKHIPKDEKRNLMGDVQKTYNDFLKKNLKEKKK